MANRVQPQPAPLSWGWGLMQRDPQQRDPQQPPLGAVVRVDTVLGSLHLFWVTADVLPLASFLQQGKATLEQLPAGGDAWAAAAGTGLAVAHEIPRGWQPPGGNGGPGPGR